MNTGKTSMRYLPLLLLLLFMLIGCSSKDEAPVASGEVAEPVQVTAYSSRSELFMEYDQLVAGEKGGFLLHLTRLSDFKPVTTGGMKMTFTPATGDPAVFTVPAPARPGIYKAELALPKAGSYSLKITTDGAGFEDEIAVPGVVVLAKGEKPPEGPAAGGGSISYLKEQQWVVDFMVAQPERKDLDVVATAVGELVPMSNAEATVTAPLAGAVSTARQLPFPGKKVAKGEVVALIDPPVGPGSGIGELEAAHAEARSRVVLAQKEHDRTKRLHEAKIAPLKRVEEAEAALSAARAALAPLERGTRRVSEDGGGRIVLRAPVSGTVAEVFAGAGRGVEAGMPILRIVNTGTLWLKASIPSNAIGSANSALTATFTVAGIPGEFKPSRLVSVGNMLDPQTRTLPVLFEVPNPSEKLKAGLFTEVAIRTGSVPGALALPKEALFEDEGRWFVFVQPSGEAFDRREVKIGVEDAKLVQITDGLIGDERVVTRGAYYVRQAESAAKGGKDAGHAH